MKIPVYLYTNLFELTVDLDNNNRIMQKMYQRDLKLQKGMKNKIQLQFKNSDQKLIDISQKQFVFTLFDTTNQRNLIEKDVTIIDTGSTSTVYSSKGLAEVVFTESDLDACDSTSYRFGVKVLDIDGSYVPTYANTYYDVAGTVEVKHDLFPTLLPSQEVSAEVFNSSETFNHDADAQWYEYYSGNLNAHPEFSSNVALHTAAIYMTKFKGRVIVEGTLENSPGTFGNYAIVSDVTYNGFTGIDYVNFNGVFSKVRIRYIPAKEPISQQNNLTWFSGTVDKALYRS